MPTPVLTNTMLGWAYQTEVINLILPTSSFLKQLMFGDRSITLPTESVELSYIVGEHSMAPFVEVNGEAVMVGSRGTVFDNVSCPNIRIKRPMDAYTHMLKRRPGTGVFVDGGTVAQARRDAIAEDIQFMRDLIDTREEWMVSKLLTDTTAANITLEYQVAERANWKVTVPRPHATEFVKTPGTPWSNTAAPMMQYFHSVKETMSKYQRLVPTDCIMGATAALEFLANVEVKGLLDNKNIDAGSLTLTTQFNESGVIYLGTFMGIRCWQYNATYVSDAGSTTSFIPAEMAVFVHASPANRSLFYYGAIPDHDAQDEGLLETKIFTKSWREKDPSTYVQLAHTRPLPHLRKTGAVVVMNT